MLVAVCTQIPIHSNTDISIQRPKKRRHWRNHINREDSREEMMSRIVDDKNTQIEKLQKENQEYKRVNYNLEIIAMWNLCVMHSYIRDTEQINDFLEDKAIDDIDTK